MDIGLRNLSEDPCAGRVPTESQITVLGILWTLARRKYLVALLTTAGMLSLLVLIGMMRPLYVSEATLELNFNREEVEGATTVSRQMAAVDPGALVNGAAHTIVSRANAIRVVRRLGLDAAAPEQKGFALSTIFGAVKGLFGFSSVQPSAEERAVDELLRNVKVAYKAHLYLISVSYTAHHPQSAAHIANAFAVEYLRGERLKELTSQRRIAQSELLAASEKLGTLHPRRLQIEHRIKRIDIEIDSVSNSPPDPRNLLFGVQHLTLAEPIFTPTSQKRTAIFAVGASFVFALAAVIAWLVDRSQGRNNSTVPGAATSRLDKGW
jgi:capsular polysaccharide biosynthesis protein